MIPAAITITIGLASLAMAIYAVAVMGYVIFVERYYEHVVEMVAACFMYWWVGIALVVAGVAFWRGQLRAGLIAALVGVATAGAFVAVLETAF
jgi:hypothetical protein